MHQSKNFKYSLYVDQRQCLKLGITNINQAIVFDLLAHANQWADEIIIDNEVYYWVARQAISGQLPILGLQPDTIYRHLKSLDKLNVIKHVKNGKKDCIKLTKKGKSYYVGSNSEKSPKSEENPSKIGNESENNTDLNPTDKTTNSNKTIKRLEIYSEVINELGLKNDFVLKILDHRKNCGHSKPTPHAFKLMMNNFKKCIQMRLVQNKELIVEYMVTETTWQTVKPSYLQNNREFTSWIQSHNDLPENNTAQPGGRFEL